MNFEITLSDLPSIKSVAILIVIELNRIWINFRIAALLNDTYLPIQKHCLFSFIHVSCSMFQIHGFLLIVNVMTSLSISDYF
jgi:hypothetical protein